MRELTVGGVELMSQKVTDLDKQLAACVARHDGKVERIEADVVRLVETQEKIFGKFDELKTHMTDSMRVTTESIGQTKLEMGKLAGKIIGGIVVFQFIAVVIVALLK